eukprot:4682983-Amphidinium_carterae.1
MSDVTLWKVYRTCLPRDTETLRIARRFWPSYRCLYARCSFHCSLSVHLEDFSSFLGGLWPWSLGSNVATPSRPNCVQAVLTAWKHNGGKSKSLESAVPHRKLAHEKVSHFVRFLTPQNK